MRSLGHNTAVKTVDAQKTLQRLALVTLFSHVDVPQRETVFRDDCFAQRLSSQICNHFFPSDCSHKQPCGFDFILYPQGGYINVFQFSDTL